MESIRMVLMNLLAEQHWRHKHREQTYGQERDRLMDKTDLWLERGGRG